MDWTPFDELSTVLTSLTSRREALKVLTATPGVLLGLSALGTALSACEQQPSSQPSVQVNQTGVTPEQVKAALPKLEQLAQDTLHKTGVPGMAIAVVYQDEALYLKGFGVRKAGENQPVDADTVFQLASVSKPIASTIVAAVVGDGVVSWDDPKGVFLCLCLLPFVKEKDAGVCVHCPSWLALTMVLGGRGEVPPVPLCSP